MGMSDVYAAFSHVSPGTCKWLTALATSFVSRFPQSPRLTVTESHSVAQVSFSSWAHTLLGAQPSPAGITSAHHVSDSWFLFSRQFLFFFWLWRGHFQALHMPDRHQGSLAIVSVFSIFLRLVLLVSDGPLWWQCRLKKNTFLHCVGKIFSLLVEKLSTNPILYSSALNAIVYFYPWLENIPPKK